MASKKKFVRFVQHFGSYTSGDTASFDAAEAEILVAKKKAVFATLTKEQIPFTHARLDHLKKKLAENGHPDDLAEAEHLQELVQQSEEAIAKAEAEAAKAQEPAPTEPTKTTTPAEPETPNAQ